MENPRLGGLIQRLCFCSPVAFWGFFKLTAHGRNSWITLDGVVKESFSRLSTMWSRGVDANVLTRSATESRPTRPHSCEFAVGLRASIKRRRMMTHTHKLKTGRYKQNMLCTCGDWGIRRNTSDRSQGGLSTGKFTHWHSGRRSPVLQYQAVQRRMYTALLLCIYICSALVIFSPESSSWCDPKRRSDTHDVVGPLVLPVCHSLSLSLFPSKLNFVVCVCVCVCCIFRPRKKTRSQSKNTWYILPEYIVQSSWEEKVGLDVRHAQKQQSTRGNWSDRFRLS